MESEEKDYFNCNKNNAALIQIKNVLNKIKTDITVEEIKKKINSLRTWFNREFRLIETKKKSGTAADDIPECSLWYYNDLFFIKDQIEISPTETSEVRTYAVCEQRNVFSKLINAYLFLVLFYSFSRRTFSNCSRVNRFLILYHSFDQRRFLLPIFFFS